MNHDPVTPDARTPHRPAALAAAAALAGSLLLSACGLAPGVGGPQVGGDLLGSDAEGAWPDGVHAGLIGVSGAGDAGFEYGNQYTDQAEIVDEDVLMRYALELPETADEGVYQVVAYDDANDDGDIDPGEIVARTQGDDYLYYATTAGSSTPFFSDAALEWGEGWNRYDPDRAAGEENPFQADSYTGMDLVLD